MDCVRRTVSVYHLNKGAPLLSSSISNQLNIITFEYNDIDLLLPVLN